MPRASFSYCVVYFLFSDEKIFLISLYDAHVERNSTWSSLTNQKKEFIVVLQIDLYNAF
jgi:hypothetical protein